MALIVTPEGFVIDDGMGGSAQLTDLNALLSPLPGYALLTDTMKTTALSRSLVPDVNGVWPNQPNYIPTFDIYWAAISLIGFLQAQPVIRQTSSEGTSVAVDAPNWSGLVAYYRSMSVIAGATSSGPLLVPIDIPEGPHVHPTDMSGRGDDNVDVDTDLA